MRIADSLVLMSGESSAYKSYTREESFKTWAGGGRAAEQGLDRRAGQPLGLNVDVLDLSDEARAAARRQAPVQEAEQAGGAVVFEISEHDKQKIQLIQRMLEALTGKKFKFYGLGSLKLGHDGVGRGAGSGTTGLQAPRRQGWGLEYNYHESYYEQEKMSFAARGIVRTADGREIDFSVQLNMSRSFARQLDINFRAGDAVAIDPLVINFSGAAPALTETKYSFDLDCDGREDLISFVGPGSGFLALDINGDGRINDGGELFGPGSGNGFAGLARYDEDGNGWIDEADSVYSRLRIWTKDQDGADVLFALGQKDVGAIFLGHVSTPFEMKGRENQLNGQVKSSGIFLYESGLAGTIQQIDLAV